VVRGNAVVRRCWWFLICLALLPQVAGAARVYTARDGLPQNAVMALARDGEGFLWVGTEQGLARFDGERFQRLAGLPNDNINALLAEDRVLWVGSYGGGISRVALDSGRIDSLDAAGGGLPSPFVQDLARAADGAIWVASDGGGLARVEWAEGQSPRVQSFHAAPSQSQGLPSERVWSLQRGPSGIWISTLDGLALVRNGEQERRRVAIPAPFPRGGHANIEQVLEQPDGVLWIATWNDGLYRWQQRSGAVEHFAPGLPRSAGLASTRLSALGLESDGRLWVGSERGVAYLEPSCDCLRAVDPSLLGREDADGLFVVSLLVDAQGGVWAGTYGEGLLRLAPETRLFDRQRHRRDEAESLAQGRVRALYEDHEGTLWVGSVGGGLQSVAASARLPAQAWRFQSHDFAAANADPRRDFVWSVLEDRRHNLWVGSEAGLDVLDAARAHWRHVPLDAAMGPNVRALLEDREGRLWLGGSTGLAVLDGDTLRRVAIDSDPAWQVQDRTVQALAEDSLGRVWVGSVGGLQLLDRDGLVLRRFRDDTAPVRPQGSVYALLAQFDGTMWVGGARGLCRTDARTADVAGFSWRCQDEADGLPRRTVYSLAAGTDGGLWLGTVAGLVRVGPDDGSVRVHDADDGLIGDEFAPGAVASGRDGHLYFGAAGGFLAFDPRSLHAPPPPRAVHIAAFSLDQFELAPGTSPPTQLDAAFPYARRLRLTPEDRAFGFRLTALEFDRPRDLVYAYRLAGQDAAWIQAGSPPQISYTGIAPGHYRLEARVRGPGRTWSEAQTLLELQVQPPLWATAPFRLAVVLLLLVLTWLAYRWRLGALARRGRWLEAEVAQRTQALEAQKAALADTAQALRDANLRLYELSTHDALTGVCNRRHALEEAERLRLDADAAARPLVLALIDLDHFKRLNDEHGHQAGDHALAEFGRLLRDSLEPGDLAGRYGGEEFLCVLAHGGMARARAWGEALAQRVALGGLLWQGRVLPLTVSLGLAEREVGEGGIDAWIGRADRALYRAKHEGRNRVAVAE